MSQLHLVGERSTSEHREEIAAKLRDMPEDSHYYLWYGRGWF